MIRTKDLKPFTVSYLTYKSNRQRRISGCWSSFTFRNVRGKRAFLRKNSKKESWWIVMVRNIKYHFFSSLRVKCKLPLNSPRPWPSRSVDREGLPGVAVLILPRSSDWATERRIKIANDHWRNKGFLKTTDNLKLKV